jgi:hypothetical protein
MTRLSLLTALAGAALLSSFTAGLADNGQAAGAKAGTRAITSCGTVKKIEIAQSGISQNTTSPTFVDVIGSTVNFTISGSGNTCVLVDFSAQVFTDDAAPNRTLHIRAVRDGNDHQHRW